MPKPKKHIKVPGYEGPDRRSGKDRRIGERRSGLDRRNKSRWRRVLESSGLRSFSLFNRRLNKTDRRQLGERRQEKLLKGAPHYEKGFDRRWRGERRFLNETAKGKGLDHISASEVTKLVEMAQKQKHPAEYLLSIGLNAKELKDRGYTATTIAFKYVESTDPDVDSHYDSTNFNIGDLKKLGFGIGDLPKLLSVRELINGGYSIAEIRKAGINSKTVIENLNATELKGEGFTVRKLKKFNWSARHLDSLGFSLREILEGGYTESRLLKEGYTRTEINRARQ